mgnify:CR=1 FL=1
MSLVALARLSLEARDENEYILDLFARAHKMTIRLNSRHLVAVLVVVIIIILGFWRPWEENGDRTVSITGEATLRAAPDEFIFSPLYERQASSSKEAISAVSELGNGVVEKLKKLGVIDQEIKTQVTTNQGFGPITDQQTDKVTAQYSLTIVIHNQELAQKILDYIVTSPVLYSVLPQSIFSPGRRKELEKQARSLALTDAKAKAKQSADELGIRVGRVISINEPNWGGPIPMTLEGQTKMDVQPKTTSPILLTGEQDFTFAVTVVFRLR